MLAAQIKALREEFELRPQPSQPDTRLKEALCQFEGGFDASELQSCDFGEVTCQIQARALAAVGALKEPRLKALFANIVPVGLNLVHDFVEVVPRVYRAGGFAPHPDDVRERITRPDFLAALEEIGKCGSAIGGEIRDRAKRATYVHRGYTLSIYRGTGPDLLSAEGLVEANFNLGGAESFLELSKGWVDRFRAEVDPGEPSGGCPARKVASAYGGTLLSHISRWAITQYQRTEIPVTPSDWSYKVKLSSPLGPNGLPAVPFPLSLDLYINPHPIQYRPRA